MNDIKLNPESSTIKFMQIANSIVKGSESGEIKKNTGLPLITVFSKGMGAIYFR